MSGSASDFVMFPKHVKIDKDMKLLSQQQLAARWMDAAVFSAATLHFKTICPRCCINSQTKRSLQNWDGTNDVISRVRAGP